MRASKIYLLLVLTLFLLISCSDDKSPNSFDDSNIVPNTSAQKTFSEECVDEINRYRATEGLEPLERWEDQEDCVSQQAKSDAAVGTSHSSFKECDERAQNECPGYRSVDGIISTCLKMMWEEGPGEPFSEHGHYINMSSTNYSKVACSYYETDDGKIWSIQNFR